MTLRMPVAAGRFYAADAAALREEVRGYLPLGGNGEAALACMVPHAGHVFSGAVAGLTLARIRPPANVILIGPNHTGRGAELALWPDGAWRTPLGDVPVDAAGVQSLSAKDAFFQADRNAHLHEHSLEVILPFLQLLRPDIQILPLAVRSYDLAKLARAGRAIADMARERREAGEEMPLLLASSDMSHHLPHDQGRALDALALEQMEKLDPEGLFRVCVNKKISMCGFAAVTLTLYACLALGADRCRVTAHTSSGVTGRAWGAGMDSVVGYAGAIIG